MGRISEAPKIVVAFQHQVPFIVPPNCTWCTANAIVSGVRQNASKLASALTGETILQMSPLRGSNTIVLI
jgi:hypothetical protein